MKKLFTLLLILVSINLNAVSYIALDKAEGYYKNEVAYFSKFDFCFKNIDLSVDTIKVGDDIYPVSEVRTYEYKRHSKNVLYYCFDGFNECFFKLILYHDGRKILIFRTYDRYAVKYKLYNIKNKKQ